MKYTVTMTVDLSAQVEADNPTEAFEKAQAMSLDEFIVDRTETYVYDEEDNMVEPYI